MLYLNYSHTTECFQPYADEKHTNYFLFINSTFTSFEKIIKKYSFTLQNWADFLHISNKTLSRYQKESKTFDALQSERILQIEILYSKGEVVFGERENFTKWLETNNLALGDILPLDLLKTSFGIQLLIDELTRIEHGVLA